MVQLRGVRWNRLKSTSKIQNKKITNFSFIFWEHFACHCGSVVSFVAEVVDAQKQQILGLTVKKEMPMLDGQREPSPVEINDSNSTILGRGVSWGSTWKARWSENNRRRYNVIYIYTYYCVCFYVGCVCLCFLFDSYFVTLVDQTHGWEEHAAFHFWA